MGKSLVESRGGGGGGGSGLECYVLGAHHHAMVVREEKVVGDDGLSLTFPEGRLANKPLTAAELVQESEGLSAIGFGLRVLA